MLHNADVSPKSRESLSLLLFFLTMQEGYKQTNRF